jgi:hypothetical protein
MRKDLGSNIPWSDKQEIKNQLCGSEYEGIELFPSESRMVDQENMYHLWVNMNKGFRFPYGFKEERDDPPVVTKEPDMVLEWDLIE